MVFYYTTVDDAFEIYVGRDKHENELLIQYGWENDVWFHVDKLSSAHVYLRLKDGVTIDSIPEDVLQDCLQLVKHNSIEGNKLNNVGIVYCYWGNLKKTGDMEVGQVGFHNRREVRRAIVPKRSNPVVNRLNKTKREANPDLAQAKADRVKELNKLARLAARKKALDEEARQAQQQAEKEARSYDRIHKPENMMSNKNLHQDPDAFEDDFM